MLKYEKDYLDALQYILDEGKWVKNKRTGVDCLTVPFLDFTYEPEDVPLLTVKHISKLRNASEWSIPPQKSIRKIPLCKMSPLI